MEKELIITKDGSHSLFVADLNETYHSVHGSISESMHVFIINGYLSCIYDKINILEVGFGTGLNALLTLENNNKKVHYTALEPYPISKKIYSKLNYSSLTNIKHSTFLKMHTHEWEKDINISNSFTLHKTKNHFQNYNAKKTFDIIYFDAFAPEKHVEMWEKAVFCKCFDLLNSNGFLVTYCAKGMVKRTIKSVGFELETLEGPPGKREMIRASRR